jgi:hypothetical protein
VDQQRLQPLPPLSALPELSDFPPYSSKTSFSLPVSSSLLFLHSRGSNGHGTIKFVLGSGDNIEVDVVASYFTQVALSRANVCHLKRTEGGQGIGFFVSQ